MLQIAWSQASRRWSRSLAVVLAIVVAAVSFALLTSEVASAKLQVQGTVNANFQSAYDILVRPKDSTMPLERSDKLVAENYLAGIHGGISMKQYQQIQHISGVQVAAPIAMIGYVLAATKVAVPVEPDPKGPADQLYRVTPSWKTDNGLSTVPDRQTYIYFTDRPVNWHPKGGGSPPVMVDPTTGKQIAVCTNWEQNAELKPERSAFDLSRKVDLQCASDNDPGPGSTFGVFKPGHTGVVIYYQFPLLVAAIDPAAEAKLVGLDGAIAEGRYLTAQDQTEVKDLTGQGQGNNTVVPVLMADQPLTQDDGTAQVQRVDVPDPDQLPDRLSKPDATSWLSSLQGTDTSKVTYSDQSVYPQLLKAYRADRTNAAANYWSAGQVRYRATTSGHQQPQTVTNDASTFLNTFFGGYYAPQVSGDVGFRKLTNHQVSVTSSGNTFRFPVLHQVGVFDPSKIAGFSALSKVPLTTYHDPDAAPADASSSTLLGGKSLLPNANLAGYLQQPPTMLTTIRSLPAFLNDEAYPTVTAQERNAPISVIRVRVADVHGADAESRERVRVVAQEIAEETGLTVDITAGSSPTPETIDLPAGKFGRPALQIKEGWVKKGVSVLLLTSVDRKSLALFLLVLIVCLLFLSNATVAAVRTRRAELGVLACVGWPARRIFALLEAELLVTGAVAGVLGTGLAAALIGVLGLDVAWWHLVPITPVATLLAALAGIWPCWRASHTTPIEAITPPAVAPRRARNVDSIAKLAWVGVRRLPGRAALGAASLLIGVAALAVLVAVQQAFQGKVTGTALGDYISVQVRGVDYLAAAITIGLGAFAVADIAYLNIAERTAEIGTLRSTGWTENHLRRLFGTEALITATLGALIGAAVGVGVTALLLPVGLSTVAQAGGLAATAGVVAAMLATAAPLARISRLAPAHSVQ